MPNAWTAEQASRFAPDEASEKNARDLAVPQKWFLLRKNELPGCQVIWGEVKGSGEKPYRCQVDLTGPEFNCTCPSRKHPCKHALGLLLLYAGQPGTFQPGEPPDWVAGWLAKRSERGRRKSAEKTGPGASPQQEQAAAPAEEPPVEPAAAQDAAKSAAQISKAKRAAERDRRIRAGLDDLEVWLRDLLRQGLASAQGEPRSFWEAPAARLVDAQAPGAARVLREMRDLAALGDGWQDQMLLRIARLYLLMEGYRRIDSLPEAAQADVRAQIGITTRQEELEHYPGLRDTWMVMGREIEEEEKLKTQRTWLWGMKSGKAAAVLSFAPPGGTLDTSLPPGAVLAAELVYYPSAYPLRALIRRRASTAQMQPVEAIKDLARCGSSSLLEAAAGYTAALAASPWVERYPFLLNGVTPLYEDGEWALYDSQDRRILISRGFSYGWGLLAISGGRPVGLFGEWDGSRILPLSAWTDDQFYAFRPRLE